MLSNGINCFLCEQRYTQQLGDYSSRFTSRTLSATLAPNKMQGLLYFYIVKMLLGLEVYFTELICSIRSQLHVDIQKSREYFQNITFFQRPKM